MSPSQCRRLARRFGRDRRAAAAVEFALVVPMLLALVFSTMEAGWTMLQTIMLDRAVDTTIRSPRIGTMSNPTQEKVRAEVCGAAMILYDCNRTLALEFIVIRNEADYPSDADRCVNRNSTVQPVLRFNPGIRSETVFVRACFVVEPLTPGLGLGMALPKDPSGAFRIIAKSGFVNEPA